MGKGSSPRPFDVSQQVYASNWDAIFKKGKKDVFQQETKDTNGQTQGIAPAKAGSDVLRNCESTAERVTTPPTE